MAGGRRCCCTSRTAVRNASRPDHRRRRRQRLSLRRSGRARAADDAGLRGLHAAARAEAAAGRRLRVVLRHGDAAHPGRLDLDGAVPRQAHHAAGADAVGGGAGDRRRALRPPHRARGQPTSSARWSRRSTRWPPKWRQSRRRLERASIDLERKHEEGEGRRRYIEAILERIATGVVSIDRAGRIGTINPSALRLLELDRRRRSGGRRSTCSRGADLAPVNDVLDQAARAKMDSFAQEVALVRDGRERHVAAAATRVAGTDGSFDGTVLVVDDVTPLIRAQKVAAWREVARRLAHEIKNPLTPIQLSAERLRRKLERRRRRRCRIWCRSARRRSSARSSR